MMSHSPHLDRLDRLWRRLQGLVQPAAPAAAAAHPLTELSPDLARALALVQAVDAGGLPLNPMRVNDIARRLGLEVAGSAPMAQTIERIRSSLKDRQVM